MNNFHYCATCKNFKAVKDKKARYICNRLGFETHPKYRFNCWDAREDILDRMRRDK